jgi:hypothetical protein
MRAHYVAGRDSCRWIACCPRLAGAIDARLLGGHINSRKSVHQKKATPVLVCSLLLRAILVPIRVSLFRINVVFVCLWKYIKRGPRRKAFPARFATLAFHDQRAGCDSLATERLQEVHSLASE